MPKSSFLPELARSIRTCAPSTLVLLIAIGWPQSQARAAKPQAQAVKPQTKASPTLARPPGPPPLDKYVVIESVSPKTCSPEPRSAIPEDLHQRIYRNLPRALAKLNKIKAEDLETYKDSRLANFFDPEQVTVRSDANILRIVRNINLKWAFYINIQCEEGAYRWQATAIDQKMILRLLQCREVGITDDNVKICNPFLGSEDARRHGAAFSSSFRDQEVAASLREIFIQLLSSTTLRIEHDKKDEFFPNSTLEPFLVLSMPDDEDGDEPKNLSSLQIGYDVFELPDEHADAICNRPMRIQWHRDCPAGALPKRGAADSGPHRLRCGMEPANDERLHPTGQSMPGVQLKLAAPPYTARILIRAAGYDATGKNQQTPTAYRCFSVRPYPYFAGLVVSYGIPYDINSNPANSPFPPAAIFPSAFGIQFEVGGRLPSYVKRSRWFSAAYVGAAVGFHMMQGSYPCPSRHFGDCKDPLALYRALPTSSTSVAVDLRGVLRADVVRFWKMTVMLVADLGVGIEHLSSTDTPFAHDGWHGLFASRVGLGLSGLTGFAGRIVSRGAILISGETQMRLDHTYGSSLNNAFRFDAAGVSDAVATLWLSYLAHIYWLSGSSH